MAGADRYTGTCTIPVATFGLVESRFRRIGVPGYWCAQQDVEEAAALTNARRRAQGDEYAVPPCYYDFPAIFTDSDDSSSS